MLVSKSTNKFLYVYNDKNVYEFSSYETLNIDNPLVYELLKASGFYSENRDLYNKKLKKSGTYNLC